MCVSLWAWWEVLAAHHWVHDYVCVCVAVVHVSQCTQLVYKPFDAGRKPAAGQGVTSPWKPNFGTVHKSNKQRSETSVYLIHSNYTVTQKTSHCSNDLLFIRSLLLLLQYLFLLSTQKNIRNIYAHSVAKISLFSRHKSIKFSRGMTKSEIIKKWELI